MNYKHFQIIVDLVFFIPIIIDLYLVPTQSVMTQDEYSEF